MGKGSDLWDDSALINAFDHAMSTYKEMHFTNSNGKSTKEGKHASDINEKDLILVEKTAGTVESEDIGNNITEATPKMCLHPDNTNNTELATEDISTQGNTFCADARPPGPDGCSSDFPTTDGENYFYSDQQSMDYDNLVRRYHELEEQKQKVAQQLYQANYWNYQTPVQGSTCQLPQVSGSSLSEHGLQTPCSLCSCQCIAVPLISSVCAGGYNCPFQLACCAGSHTHLVERDNSCKQIPADNGFRTTAMASAVDPMNNSKADDNGVKLGMLAINRVMNSMQVELSATSNDSEEKRGKKSSAGTLEGNGPQSNSSETDLAAVLNAWYLAGFHTGRYLSEQSKKNAQP